MENQRITKSELDAALNALEHILDQPVDEIDLTDDIPPVADVADSNKVFKGKLSILFVDMRKSTDLTDELKAKYDAEMSPSVADELAALKAKHGKV